MSFYSGTTPELYYSMPAAVTKNTFTGPTCITAQIDTAIPLCMIPANYFSMIGKSLHFEANGTLECDSAATFAFSAGLDVTPNTLSTSSSAGGGELFLTVATAAFSAATTAYPWVAEFDIVAQAVGGNAAGATGGTVLEVCGEIDIANVANNTWMTATSTKLAIMIDNNVTGINNLQNLYLELFGTWSVSNAANQIITNMFKVYLEN